MPKISVIVPAFNAEKYISFALQTVLAQTFDDYEVICVDDYSTDSTSNIIQDFVNKSNKIKLYKNSKHLGPGECRNIALQLAQGEIISCVDADDAINKNLFKYIVAKFEETDVNSIWIKAKIYWEAEDKITPMYNFPYLQNQREGILELTPDNISDFPAYSWNKFYKKNSIYENVFWSKNYLYEDLEFYYRYYTQNPTVYVIDKLLYLYRRHKNSIIGKSNSEASYINQIFYVTENIYKFLKENNLFDKYKKSLLQLMINNIQEYENAEIQNQSTISVITETLNKIGFPKEYQDLNTIEK